jgi:hypothetical protein
MNSSVCKIIAFMSVALGAIQPIAAEQTKAPNTLSVAPAGNIDWISALADSESFSAANFTPAEQKSILDQIASTSFDVPESWLAELRVRRISLGRSEGIVVRATRLLCGATGNCETWVFRRTAAGWMNLLVGEAPIASSIGFVRQNLPVRDLVITANRSANASALMRYSFDGKLYRASK